MKLHATNDFRDALLAAAKEARLDERFVEKDYYMTEVLRIIVDTQPSRAIFKGGTSLSKGWQLIDRFSEDIDLFIDPEVKPALSKRGVDRELRKLRDAVAGHSAFAYIEDEGRTIGGSWPRGLLQLQLTIRRDARITLRHPPRTRNPEWEATD